MCGHHIENEDDDYHQHRCPSDDSIEEDVGGEDSDMAVEVGMTTTHSSTMLWQCGQGPG